MASTLADNSSRTLPASGRKREQEIRLFASTRRYDCKRLHLASSEDHMDDVETPIERPDVIVPDTGPLIHLAPPMPCTCSTRSGDVWS